MAAPKLLESVPVMGESRHTCKHCKCVSVFSGALYVLDVYSDKSVECAVRTCPTCNSYVIPRRAGPE